MAYSMTPADKRALADRLLTWLKAQGPQSWTRTYEILVKAAVDLDTEIFQLWKAYDVLLVMGRVERTIPHKSAGRVLDTRPLSEPAAPSPTGGLMLVKIPADRMAALSQYQVQLIRQSFKELFPIDHIVIMPLEADLVVGQAAVDDLVKMRETINKALEGKTNEGTGEKKP